MRPRRLLVIVLGRAAPDALRDEVVRRARETSVEVLVVVPALPLAGECRGLDAGVARQAARNLLQHFVSRLQQCGIPAHAMVGDPNPLQAVADAVGCFDPDALVIAAPTTGSPSALAREVATQARRCFGLPV